MPSREELFFLPPLIYLFKILKTFTKMLHTNLIGCRGKTKRDTKYNILTLKGEKNIIVLSRLKNISYPQIRKLLILSYFIKNFPHISASANL